MAITPNATQTRVQQMKRYKVRFHLAKGVNFMKWQVTDNVSKVKTYLDPEVTSLTLVDCKLRNQPTTSRKIHEGANKTVCAWIDCDQVHASEQPVNTCKPSDLTIQYRYNPRVNPHWHTEKSSNVDGSDVGILQTTKRSLYGFAN